MCQAVPKEMWIDARREDVLDAPYFHLVFTVPDILNPVIYSNSNELFLRHKQQGSPHWILLPYYTVFLEQSDRL